MLQSLILTVKILIMFSYLIMGLYIIDIAETRFEYWNNIDMFLTKCQRPEVTIMSTYNLTSVPTYHEVIKKVFELKKKHYNGKRYRHYAIILDTSYLRHPEFLQVRL